MLEVTLRALFYFLGLLSLYCALVVVLVTLMVLIRKPRQKTAWEAQWEAKAPKPRKPAGKV